MKGLTLKIPKGLTGGPGEYEDECESDFFTDAQGDGDDNQVLAATEEDDQDIMPFDTHIGSQNEDKNQSEQSQDADSDEDSILSSSSEESTSLLPSLPIILVNVEQLYGYRPNDKEEFNRLSKEITQTLLGENIGGTTDSSEETEKESIVVGEGIAEAEKAIVCDHASAGFLSRTAELFEMGIGCHTDTSQKKIIVNGCRSLNFAPIPYPEFIVLSSDFAASSKVEISNDPAVSSTRTMWRKILRSHKIPVVNRLLRHLSRCSRDLAWKLQMSTELRSLASYEKQKLREREIHLWRTKKRPQELDRLYSVRETFDLKLNLANERYDQLVKEREEKVQEELRRRLESGESNGGVSSLDWDSRVTFAFPTDKEQQEMISDMHLRSEHMNLSEDNYIDFDDFNEDGDSDDEGYIQDNDSDFYEDGELVSPDPETIPSDTDLLKEHPTRNDEDRKKRRVKAALKRAKRKMKSDQEKARIYELEAKYRDAKEEEDLVRKMCISNEERMTKAIVTNLTERLEKVDDLLDSLQEEAWKDEEEGLIDSDASDEDADITPDTESKDQMTLLDQILAMILGTIPPDTGSTTDNHFRFIKQEHDEIIGAWKEYFGELPQSWKEDEKIVLKTKSTSRSGEEVEKGALPSTWEEEHAKGHDTVSALSSHFDKLPADFKSLESSNVPDDWEDIELDDIFPASGADKNQERHHSDEPPKVVGLRPGGSSRAMNQR